MLRKRCRGMRSGPPGHTTSERPHTVCCPRSAARVATVCKGNEFHDALRTGPSQSRGLQAGSGRIVNCLYISCSSDGAGCPSSISPLTAGFPGGAGPKPAEPAEMYASGYRAFCTDSLEIFSLEHIQEAIGFQPGSKEDTRSAHSRQETAI